MLTTVFRSGSAPLLDEIEARLTWVELARGELLCREGDPADGMYLVVRGRLAAVPADRTKPPRVLFEAGDTVGTWALLTDAHRASDVVAVQPSHVARLDRESFDRLAAAHPVFMRDVAASVVDSVRSQLVWDGTLGEPAVLAVVPVDGTERARRFAAALAEGLGHLGHVAHLTAASVDLSSGDGLAVEHRIDQVQAEADFVVLEARPDDGAWYPTALHRADHLVLVASGESDPAPLADEARLSEADPRLRRGTSLVLVHAPDVELPTGTDRWLDARSLDAHHHAREDRLADAQRIARMLTGRGIGFVMSGGGARGNAHVGVLAALLERGIPIDFVGGTSAGGGIASLVARYGAYDDIHERMLEYFVRRRPVGIPTLPILSLIGGGAMDRTAKDLYGDALIEDLWLPFFCVATNLTTGQPEVIRRGPVWRATRATTSVPALMPPVMRDGQVLVDGGVLDNFPALTMKRLCGGPVIGCDVQVPGGGADFTLDGDELPGVFRLLMGRLAGEKMVVPSIGHVLSRVATIGHTSGYARQREACAIYLAPDVEGVGMVDFHRFEELAGRALGEARDALVEADLDARLELTLDELEPSHEPPTKHFASPPVSTR